MLRENFGLVVVLEGILLAVSYETFRFLSVDDGILLVRGEKQQQQQLPQRQYCRDKPLVLQGIKIWAILTII